MAMFGRRGFKPAQCSLGLLMSTRHPPALMLKQREEDWKFICGLSNVMHASILPSIRSAVAFCRPPRVVPKIIFRLLSNIFTHPVFRMDMDAS